MSALIELSNREFRLIRELVYNKFGINLTEQKKSLVVGRLQKVLREKSFSSFSQYYDYIVSDRTGQALTTLINRISTNHTFFYRENGHFDYFVRTVLPQIREQLNGKGKKLRIWCAGCSSGEEPYAISMMVSDFFGAEINLWDVGILATDISEKVLSIARSGVYTEENVSRLPAIYRSKYFKRMSGDQWSVSDRIKKSILYKRFNLMRTQLPFRGKFHVIFCRNVMIYFDTQTKHALVDRFFKITEPDGYLFIGHSETLGRQRCPYEYVKPAVYRKEP